MRQIINLNLQTLVKHNKNNIWIYLVKALWVEDSALALLVSLQVDLVHRFLVNLPFKLQVSAQHHKEYHLEDLVLALLFSLQVDLIHHRLAKLRMYLELLQLMHLLIYLLKIPTFSMALQLNNSKIKFKLLLIFLEIQMDLLVLVHLFNKIQCRFHKWLKM